MLESHLTKNIPDTIKEGLKHRLGDPFISAYSATFLIFNFEILLFLFSSDYTVDEKINRIHKALTWGAFFWPALTTSFILLLFPYFATPLYRFLEKNKVERQNIIHAAEDKLRPNKARIQELELMLNQEAKRTNDQIAVTSEKDQLIGKAQQKIVDLEKKFKEKHNELVALQNEVSKLYNNAESQEAPNTPLSHDTDALVHSIGVDPNLIRVVPRDYAENNSLTPEITSNQYLEATQTIINYVKSKNDQSNRIKLAYSAFSQAFKNKHFGAMINSIKQMREIETLRSDEKTLVKIAEELIKKVHQYLA